MCPKPVELIWMRLGPCRVHDGPRKIEGLVPKGRRTDAAIDRKVVL
jgi:hypothetical protein